MNQICQPLHPILRLSLLHHSMDQSTVHFLSVHPLVVVWESISTCINFDIVQWLLHPNASVTAWSLVSSGVGLKIAKGVRMSFTKEYLERIIGLEVGTWKIPPYFNWSWFEVGVANIIYTVRRLFPLVIVEGSRMHEFVENFLVWQFESWAAKQPSCGLFSVHSWRAIGKSLSVSALSDELLVKTARNSDL